MLFCWWWFSIFNFFQSCIVNLKFYIFIDVLNSLEYYFMTNKWIQTLAHICDLVLPCGLFLPWCRLWDIWDIIKVFGDLVIQNKLTLRHFDLILIKNKLKWHTVTGWRPRINEKWQTWAPGHTVNLYSKIIN